MAALAPLEGVAPVPVAAAVASAPPPAAADAFSLLMQGAQMPAQKPPSQPPAQLHSAPLQKQPTVPLPHARAAAGLPMDAATDLCLLVDALLVGKPQCAAMAATAATEPATGEQCAPSATATSPEQFLQWLAAIKPVALPQPAPASADAAPSLALDTITALPPSLLAAEAERAGSESASAALQNPGSAPPLAAATAVLPQAVSAITSPVATGHTALAMDSPDWPQRLGEQIQWRLGEGLQEARIEISPRELGTVQLHLSMDEGGLRVHLAAAQADTRNLLQNELPRLREVLQQGGVPLADAQVGREAPGQQQGRHAAGSASPGRLDEDAEPPVAARSAWSARRGLLDDYA